MDATATPSIAIIIVNWNGADDTISCLHSLVRIGYSHLRLYVVDNASTDGSPARIRAAHADAHMQLLVAPVNLGYAGGVNLGVARALADGADYLWVLNNDVSADPDIVGHLLEAARDTEPAILSPKILYRARPTELWWAGGGIDRRLKSYHIGIGERDAGQHEVIRAIDWATGCSLFFSAATARRIGPMDERYFLYLEDVDWSLRARARGVPIVYVPAARLYHDVSHSTARLQSGHVWYYSWRNYYLLVLEHGHWWQRLRAATDLMSRFVKIGLRYAFFPAYRHDAYYHARTRGLIDFVRGRFGSCRLPHLHHASSVASRRGIAS